MEKLIILKYGELNTKKGNKNFFLSKLKENIELSLKDIEHETIYDFGRMFIKTKETETVAERLKCVFGILDIIIGYRNDLKTIDEIKADIETLVFDKNFQTFKVTTKRSNKNFPLDSMEISRILGAVILKGKADIHVDVHKPEFLISVEIRKNDVLYYFEEIKGLGGYPVGTLGKGLLMLSGGIDSPVAGFYTIKRGVSLEAVYFESPPHTSEDAKNKVISLARVLAKYNTNVKLHVINFTEIQETILKNIEHEYLITIMRRMMYRISEKLALKNKCNILVNGESIGQVASQTLTSMGVINEVVKMPVIRPLACFDKLEIIDVAKKIGTYDISIQPFEDCCTIFVPKHPVINPELEKCHEFEKLIPYEKLIDEAIQNETQIYVTLEKTNKYQDLL